MVILRRDCGGGIGNSENGEHEAICLGWLGLTQILLRVRCVMNTFLALHWTLVPRLVGFPGCGILRSRVLPRSSEKRFQHGQYGQWTNFYRRVRNCRFRIVKELFMGFRGISDLRTCRFHRRQNQGFLRLKTARRNILSDLFLSEHDTS